MRGLLNVTKSHLLRCVAYNLGLLLRKVWGLRKPRNWEEGAAVLVFSILALVLVARCTFNEVRPMWKFIFLGALVALVLFTRLKVARRPERAVTKITPFLTGC